jgi:hypothetical protein
MHGQFLRSLDEKLVDKEQSYRLAISSDRNVIKKESEKILK